MKSTVFATLAGLTLANNTLPTNLVTGSGVSSSTTYVSGQTTASGVLGSGLTASYQGSGVGGSGLGLGLGSGLSTGFGSGVGLGSGLAVSSSGSLSTGAAGLSSGTGLGNIGTGAVLVTANNSGAANIASGQVIVDGNYPRADLIGLSGASSTLVNNNLVASGVINNAFANTSASTRSIDSLFSKLPSSAELDNLILSADSVAILRTIQAVGTNTALPCDQESPISSNCSAELKLHLPRKPSPETNSKLSLMPQLKKSPDFKVSSMETTLPSPNWALML